MEFFGPNGQLVRGRQALGEMFAKVVKSPSEGGTCGLKITPEHTFVVGETVNVQWRADAPFLAEPYRGADAYETHDGLMAAQVTTFNAAALRFKDSAARGNSRLLLAESNRRIYTRSPPRGVSAAIRASTNISTAVAMSVARSAGAAWNKNDEMSRPQAMAAAHPARMPDCRHQ